MKNSYKMGYIENPFQIVPDFKPEYLQSGQNLPYIKTGKLVFLDNQIKIEGKKVSLMLVYLLGLITPVIAITMVLFSFLIIPVLIIDIIALFYFYKKSRKKEEIIIDIKDIEFLKTYESILGPFKIKWITINFKVKDKDFWILPNGFKGNEKEVQEILTGFKNRGLSFK